MQADLTVFIGAMLAVPVLVLVGLLWMIWRR